MAKKEVKVVKVSDVSAVVPPKHSNTSSFPLLTTEDAEHMQVFLTEIRPGGVAEKDVHPKSEHAFFVLSGRGKWIIEGKEYILEPNMFIYMPENAEHETIVLGDETLRMIVLFAPPKD